jgi:uncharacterized protein (DUF1800 family)
MCETLNRAEAANAREKKKKEEPSRHAAIRMARCIAKVASAAFRSRWALYWCVAGVQQHAKSAVTSSLRIADSEEVTRL